MRLLSALTTCLALLLPMSQALAYDTLVEKKVFSLPTYTTAGGQVIKNVLVG